MAEFAAGWGPVTNRTLVGGRLPSHYGVSPEAGRSLRIRIPISHSTLCNGGLQMGEMRVICSHARALVALAVRPGKRDGHHNGGGDTQPVRGSCDYWCGELLICHHRRLQPITKAK